jgi:hypothetical protein
MMVASEEQSRFVEAVQDVDCLDRVKFRFDLGRPLPASFAEAFPGAEITLRRFSQVIKGGHDMIVVREAGAFRAEGLIGQPRLIAAFEGDPDHWPRPVMAIFEAGLSSLGFGPVHYRRGGSPNCAECTAGVLKGCRHAGG